MQMFGFAQLTLFDQMNIICNTPCYNTIVNTTHCDRRYFAKLVKKFEFVGAWSHVPPKDKNIKLKWVAMFREILPKYDLGGKSPSLSLLSYIDNKT